jgi:S1-C subfamily serine protease
MMRYLAILVAGLAISGCVNQPNIAPKNRNAEIFATIVNISFVGSFGTISRGSGTMIHSSGVILTNAHIIPRDYSAYGAKYQCLISIPDPETGAPKEMYYGKPVLVDQLSAKYDLAFVQIEGAAYDRDSREYQGVFPRKFIAYDDEKYCRSSSKLALGDKISVYGYPQIGGGRNLIISEGIVSGFDREKGWIFTSAKMSHGNSGGLAVDANGCMIGVPARVSRDELESMGMVLSAEKVQEFCNEIMKSLEGKPAK